MRIAQVIARIDDPAAGPSYSVPRLCEALAEHGHCVDLYTVRDRAHAARSLPLTPGWATHRFAAAAPHPLVASPALRKQLRAAALSNEFELIHNHGMWLLPNLYAYLAAMAPAQAQHTPLLFSPRGALAPWALDRSRWRKRASSWLWQSEMLQRVRCFHATAEHEAEDIRRLGLRQPICVIPNGIDIPLLHSAEAQQPRTLLYLGRIHPAKGLVNLLRAWGRVVQIHTNWQLRIAGPDNGGHLEELRTLTRELHLERVQFDPPCYGDERTRAYGAAALFVLPSHTENFGLTVAEALAAGTPAIVSKGAPWQTLSDHNAGWWVDNGEESLATVLDVALRQKPETLAAMGDAGRRWMCAALGWQAIAARMSEVYCWLLHGGAVPRDVIVQ